MISTDPRARAVRGASRPPIKHAEDPAHPGTALCGAKLGRTPASARGDRCVVCADLARRTFVGR
jgi:hypothetical protein